MNLRSLRLIIGTAISVAALCAPSLALAGAWGVGSFENDDAADWSSACSQSLGIGPVVRALNDVFSPGYLEAPQAAEAIAAAEVVAAALGRPVTTFLKTCAAGCSVSRMTRSRDWRGRHAKRCCVSKTRKHPSWRSSWQRATQRSGAPSCGNS